MMDSRPGEGMKKPTFSGHQYKSSFFIYTDFQTLKKLLFAMFVDRGSTLAPHFVNKSTKRGFFYASQMQFYYFTILS